MILMVCVDDHYGMMFNHRRQSSDRVVREQLLQSTEGGRLWMNGHSCSMFTDVQAGRLEVRADFLEKAGAGEYCFVEDRNILPYEAKLEKIILFKWNRSYPADFYFPADILLHGWIMTAFTEFAGSSHEKITKEEYKRNEENR